MAVAEDPGGAVATLERAEPGPEPAVLLPPIPARSPGSRRGRRLTLLVAAALIAVVGVLAAYAFSAGLLGAAAEPEARETVTGQLASEIVSEPGTGTLAESAAPKKGFVGRTQRFEAIGFGTWLSPGFMLGPGETSVVYTGEGALGDVVIVLVPQFPADPSQAPGETGCYAGCTATTLSGTFTPGRYKLSITTTAATTWKVGIWQRIPPADAPIVVDKPDGTSSVKVSSKGEDRSAPFTVQATAVDGVVAIVGDVSAKGAFAAYLVPRGRTLDAKKDLVYRQRSGDGGRFQAEVRTRGDSPEQTYTLVVRTKGAWTVRFATS